MKRRGGYVTADVIDVNPATPNLEAMLAKFDKEHTHDEDEVRFILAGRGIFFLNLGDESPRSKWVRAICCACRAERRTGSRSARIAASAPFAGFRTPRAGRRITPARVWTRVTSRCASVRRISGRARHWHPRMTKPRPRKITRTTRACRWEPRSCSCWTWRARLHRFRWSTNSFFLMRARISRGTCKSMPPTRESQAISRMLAEENAGESR